MKTPVITIDKKMIGQGNPAYIIAEAGSNHNNDFQTAKKLIEAAADAGADAVKFQAFKAKHHYSKYTPAFSYLKNLKIDTPIYDLIKSVEINREWHAALMEHAKACNITFLSSPCDREAIDQLHELGMPAFKLASFDLPDVTLIRYMAKLGKPIILSTGMANYTDIENALKACRAEGNEQIIILQCTSLYPAPVHITNLSAIETMHRAFGVHVGYSDHTEDYHITLASIAMGAVMIEKHFTLSRQQPGPDHTFAIEPHELKDMVRKIRDIEAARGDGVKRGPSPEEAEMFQKARRSIHVKRELKAGDVITQDDLCIKRPGYGIAPAQLDSLVGMVVKKDVREDYWLTWEDLK